MDLSNLLQERSGVHISRIDDGLFFLIDDRNLVLATHVPDKAVKAQWYFSDNGPLKDHVIIPSKVVDSWEDDIPERDGSLPLVCRPYWLLIEAPDSVVMSRGYVPMTYRHVVAFPEVSVRTGLSSAVFYANTFDAPSVSVSVPGTGKYAVAVNNMFGGYRTGDVVSLMPKLLDTHVSPFRIFLEHCSVETAKLKQVREELAKINQLDSRVRCLVLDAKLGSAYSCEVLILKTSEGKLYSGMHHVHSRFLFSELSDLIGENCFEAQIMPEYCGLLGEFAGEFAPTESRVLTQEVLVLKGRATKRISEIKENSSFVYETSNSFKLIAVGNKVDDNTFGVKAGVNVRVFEDIPEVIFDSFDKTFLFAGDCEEFKHFELSARQVESLAGRVRNWREEETARVISRFGERGLEKLWKVLKETYVKGLKLIV